MGLFGGGSKNAEKDASASKTPERVATLQDLEGFVEYVVKALVDDPDSVKVTTEDGENSVKVIKVACRKEDTGKIIGERARRQSQHNSRRENALHSFANHLKNLPINMRRIFAGLPRTFTV